MSERKGIVFVVNPASAAGATLRRFERLRGDLRRQVGDFEVKLTQRAGHATELTRESLAAGAATVVAVGGDGTNHEVVNGFFDPSGAPLGEGAALGVLTSGTGGDFRKTFSWSDDPKEAVERLGRGNTRKIDVGRVTLTLDDGTEHSRFFLNIASFGLSGAVDDVVNRGSKRLGGKASFLVGTVQAFVGYQPPVVRLIYDGGEPFEERISVVAVANGQYFGGGMWIAPAADVCDGKLTVVRVKDAGKRFWLKHAAKVYSGKHTSLAEVVVQDAATLSAEPVGGGRVLLDLDGEQIGQLPARFEVLPHAVSLIV